MRNPTGAERLWRRWQQSDNRLLFVLTVALGILSGLAAVAFHTSIDFVEAHLLAPALAHSAGARAAWLFALLGSAGLIVGILLQYVFPYARGSGIPEVKLEYATTPGARLSARTVIGKFLLGALAIGSGFSLGREGPTVQICAVLGAALSRVTRQSPRVARNLVCIGAAAGIAAAFNTPIAAITFALEEIVGDLNQRLLGAVVVATVAAAVVEHAILGGQPVFAVPAYALGRWWELIGYALLGVLAAIAATIFVKALLWLRAAVRRLRRVPAWAKPALGGLLVAAVGIPYPAVLGIGYGPLSAALIGHVSLPQMATLSIVKLIATVLSYSWGAGRRHLRAGAVHRRHARRRARRRAAPDRASKRRDRRVVRARGDGRVLRRLDSGADYVNSHHLRNDGRLRDHPSADDRQHDRVHAGDAMAAGADLRRPPRPRTASTSTATTPRFSGA